jgi:(2R)-phospho-3-sulfolactate synthase (ComA)
MRSTDKQSSMLEYVQLIGVRELPPLTCPFDPGYDPVTVESHLAQSAHLMETLKISMACWMIADESATRRKIAAALAHNVPTVTGGGPFEVAVAQGQLEAYLDLCADIGVSRIECGEGFTTLSVQPRIIVRMARERGLAVQYEMGRLHRSRCGKRLRAGGNGWMQEQSSWLLRREKARVELERLAMMERSTWTSLIASRVSLVLASPCSKRPISPASSLCSTISGRASAYATYA